MSIAAEEPEVLPAVETEALDASVESASYLMRAPHSGTDGGPVEWRVEVYPDGDLISRRVWLNGHRQWDDEGVIWPAWPERSQDEITAAGAPLEDTQKYWSKAGNRLRDSAKWTATVLGAGLAALVGTSPLRGMNEHRMPVGSMALGGAGLVLIGVTLLLVLLVMCPRSVSIHDVETARRRRFLPDSACLRAPLFKWQLTVQSEQDLYLPCGVTSVTGLRQAMSVEECTLMALSRATATALDKKARKNIHAAQTARGARLLELRTAATQVATIGEYYNLKRRSTRASVGGVILGVTATACIIAAFAWPLH